MTKLYERINKILETKGVNFSKTNGKIESEEDIIRLIEELAQKNEEIKVDYKKRLEKLDLDVVNIGRIVSTAGKKIENIDDYTELQKKYMNELKIKLLSDMAASAKARGSLLGEIWGGSSPANEKVIRKLESCQSYSEKIMSIVKFIGLKLFKRTEGEDEEKQRKFMRNTWSIL